MKTGEGNSYKSGLKFTSLFGGVQFFMILFSLIRSKFIAVLLGPAGMGIYSLLSSATQLLGSITELGLSQTAIRDISIAHHEGSQQIFGRKVSAFRRIIWLTATCGMLLCMLLSPILSKITFGNYDYTIAFIILSVSLLGNQLAQGNKALLQGTSRLKELGKASVYGSLCGLLISIPLYYLMGIEGIVPTMLLTSLAMLILTFWFARRIPYQKTAISNLEALKEGKRMIHLGVFVMLQSVFSLLCAYIIRVYIGYLGGVEDVGLFNSAFLIIDAVVSMVYTAIGSEYYPRLSAGISDQQQTNHAINQQIHISLVILGPILSLFLLFGELALIILYSSSFTSVTLLIQIAIFGAFLRGPALCFAYVFLAKGDTKAFWINEFTSICFELFIHIFCYTKWGLTGLGIAYLLSYLQFLLQSFLICKFRYHYTLDLKLLRIFIPQLLIGCALFATMNLLEKSYSYPVGICLAGISIGMAIYELRKKLQAEY